MKHSVHLHIVALIAAALIAAVALPGCTGTRSAYSAAQSDPVAVAYVVTEHYAALVHEAANLKERASTPARAVSAMQKADQAAKPVVLKLRGLVQAYQSGRSAESAAQLQVALDDAVRKVADLIAAVKQAASTAGGPSLFRSEPQRGSMAVLA